MQLFDLTGRTALVTGSSGGIGYTLAEGLAGAGARIIVNGRNAEKLGAAAARLREARCDVIELPFDVTDRKSVV